MGALIDLLPKRLPADLPAELLVGWAVWVLGGLLLMLWFTRRSARPRLRDVAPLTPPTGAARLSGTHAAAVRQSSGTQAAVRKSSGTHRVARTASGTHATVAPVTYGAPTAPPPMDRPQSGVRPPSAARIPDAYAELSALLDTSQDPPRTD